MSAAVQHSERAIVVAVDFSADAKAALLWAARQADLERAPLHILHVVHDPAASPGFYRKPGEAWLRPMVDIAEEMMTEFIDRAKAEHRDLASLQTATTQLIPGLPASRIVEVADSVGARLVVIGSRGRTGLQSILLGSVAERVVQTCRVPTVVVKAASAEAPR